MFVVLEGLDRAGKSTQLQLLEAHLSSKNIPFESFKYPGMYRKTLQVGCYDPCR